MFFLNFFNAIYIVAAQRSIYRGSDGRVYSIDGNTLQTTTICSYNWDNHDATVVCKELALGTFGMATNIPRNYTYLRSMFNVQCSGNESTIFNCMHDTYDYSYMCTSMGDAGVECSYNSRYSSVRYKKPYYFLKTDMYTFYSISTSLHENEISDRRTCLSLNRPGNGHHL